VGRPIRGAWRVATVGRPDPTADHDLLAQALGRSLGENPMV
jgi:hypothetical protein